MDPGRCLTAPIRGANDLTKNAAAAGISRRKLLLMSADGCSRLQIAMTNHSRDSRKYPASNLGFQVKILRTPGRRAAIIPSYPLALQGRYASVPNVF